MALGARIAPPAGTPATFPYPPPTGRAKPFYHPELDTVRFFLFCAVWGYHAPRWTPENRPVVDGAKPASGRAAPSESVVPRSSVIEQAPHVGSGQSRRGLRPRPQLRQCRVKGVTIWSRRISEGLMTPRKRRWWGHG